MNLSDYILVPGIVVNAEDPNKLGCVKCSAVGLFNTETMPQEVLPWVKPFYMNKHQTFSKPVIGDKIWVLHNQTNKNEYWYINFFELSDSKDSSGFPKEIVQNKYENNIDLIMFRKTLDGNSTISYDDKEGIIIKINDATINILPNGDINIDNTKAQVKIAGDKIQIGKTGSNTEQHAVLGDKLKELFGSIASVCDKLATKSATDHANQLVNPFKDLAGKFRKIDQTISQDITIS